MIATMWQENGKGILQMKSHFSNDDRARSPTYLYRYFDDAGLLLYVGITCDFYSRHMQHIRSGRDRWMSDASRISIEEFPSRRMAEAAEDSAISRETPLHNLKALSVVDYTSKPDDWYLATTGGNLIGKSHGWFSMTDDAFFVPVAISTPDISKTYRERLDAQDATP